MRIYSGLYSDKYSDDVSNLWENLIEVADTESAIAFQVWRAKNSKWTMDSLRSLDCLRVLCPPEPALKPCPFCGSADVAHILRKSCVICWNCCSEGPCGTSNRRAVALWNKRA